MISEAILYGGLSPIRSIENLARCDLHMHIDITRKYGINYSQWCCACRQQLDIEAELETLHHRLALAAGTQDALQSSREEAEHLQEEVEHLHQVSADQEAAAAAEQELRARVWPRRDVTRQAGLLLTSHLIKLFCL